MAGAQREGWASPPRNLVEIHKGLSPRQYPRAIRARVSAESADASRLVARRLP